jgi:hypothetical protein
MGLTAGWLQVSKISAATFGNASARFSVHADFTHLQMRPLRFRESFQLLAEEKERAHDCTYY